MFRDIAAPTKTSAKGRSRKDRTGRAEESELQQAREELQTTREEMQSSREELQSANEELQSANEELQSTNEELTTSREELQSLNEELQTVNAELQARVEELSLTNSDMSNLLNSTDIATIFLDGKLNVRRFTPRATSIVKLIASDVGRPVTDLSSTLVYPELADDVREVLRTLVFCEKELPTRDERWYVTRIMPYRTPEDRIDGVVITFSDITVAKKLEDELRRVQHGLQADVAAGAEELQRTSALLKAERGDSAEAQRSASEKENNGKAGKQ
jgi:two-component system CheB/CheR fusion protein